MLIYQGFRRIFSSSSGNCCFCGTGFFGDELLSRPSNQSESLSRSLTVIISIPKDWKLKMSRNKAQIFFKRTP